MKQPEDKAIDLFNAAIKECISLDMQPTKLALLELHNQLLVYTHKNNVLINTASTFIPDQNNFSKWFLSRFNLHRLRDSCATKTKERSLFAGCFNFNLDFFQYLFIFFKTL